MIAANNKKIKISFMKLFSSAFFLRFIKVEESFCFMQAVIITRSNSFDLVLISVPKNMKFRSDFAPYNFHSESVKVTVALSLSRCEETQSKQLFFSFW